MKKKLVTTLAIAAVFCLAACQKNTTPDAPVATPTTEPVATATATPEPTVEPTAEPTVEPTATPEPTAEPTVEPTVEPTATPEPTAEPTATPEPTAEPTVEPTATPTQEPTAEPTVEPTATPTPEPTPEPTAVPELELQYIEKLDKYSEISNDNSVVGATRIYGICGGVFGIENDNGKVGIANSEGEIIIPMEYESLSGICTNGVFVLKDEKEVCHAFDSNGNLIVSGEEILLSDNSVLVINNEYGPATVTYQIEGPDGYERVREEVPAELFDYETYSLKEGYAYYTQLINITYSTFDLQGNLVYQMTIETVDESSLVGGDNHPAAVTSVDGGYLISNIYDFYVIDDSGKLIRTFELEDMDADGYGYMVLSGLCKGYFQVMYYSMYWGLSGYYYVNEDGTQMYDSNLFGFEADESGELFCYEMGNQTFYTRSYSFNNAASAPNYGLLLALSFVEDGTDYLIDLDKYRTACMESEKTDYYDVLGDAINKAIVMEFDYLRVSSDKHFLISQGEKWGYADHAGNLLGLYEDACDFVNGYAIVKIDGEGWVINEQLELLESIGEIEGASAGNEYFYVIRTEEEKEYTEVYQVK